MLLFPEAFPEAGLHLLSDVSQDLFFFDNGMKQDLEKRSVQSSCGAAERRQCQWTDEAPAVS